ncbi:MAG TPA: hypothetical protein VFF52_02165 [Isosphaeraceae bacterium]|nr:hypothetical protein [Isosphaeraceae bacterium]
MCRRIGMLCAAVLLTGSAVPARAELNVVISSTSIAPGSTGMIDVYLTSDASSSNPDMLNNLAFTLQITQVVGTGELQFTPAQDFSYLNAGSSPGPQYVFLGNSSDWISGQSTPPPVGGVVTQSMTGYANDTFIGFDSTNDLNPVSLSASNTPVLLARLTFFAGMNLVNPNDVYQVSLVPNSGDGSRDSGSSTYFNVVDSGFNETSHVSFGSTPGTVTITEATVVPEPASTITSLTGAVLLMAYGVRRRRGSKAQSPGSM